MFFFGGFIPSVLMVMFFVSSSVISKLKRKNKNKLEDMNEKGSRRDYIQVFANGGVAFILSIFYFFTGEFIFLIAIAVSLIGFSGSIIDSVLGAGIQGGYYDKAADSYTEKEEENGKKNILIKGF